MIFEFCVVKPAQKESSSGILLVVARLALVKEYVWIGCEKLGNNGDYRILHFLVIGRGNVVFVGDTKLIGSILPNQRIVGKLNLVQYAVVGLETIRLLPYFPNGIRCLMLSRFKLSPFMLAAELLSLSFHEILFAMPQAIRVCAGALLSRLPEPLRVNCNARVCDCSYCSVVLFSAANIDKSGETDKRFGEYFSAQYKLGRR